MWKPKEKELTVEEAVEIAKKEAAPFWFGIEPQITGVSQDGMISVFPLDQNFSKKSWLIFFIDPTLFSSESSITYAKEWYRRYHMHHLEFLFVLSCTYDFFKDRGTIYKLIEKYQLPFPVALDSEATLAAAFGAGHLPLVTLLHQGTSRFSYSGTDWLTNTETEIQSFLRASDSGLPLLPFFIPKKGVYRDVFRMELGFQPRLGREVKFLASDQFSGTPNGAMKNGFFHGVRPREMEEGILFISGSWFQDHEKIATLDSSASLGFRSPGGRVTLYAERFSQKGEIPVISVEIDGNPIYDAISGDSISLDEQGQSVLLIDRPQGYSMLIDLPEDQREVTLRFPYADQSPVAIYGIRFGD